MTGRIAALLLALATPAGAATQCVNPTGSGGCFNAVQLAVDAAGSGDTIEIDAGTYLENVVVPAGKRLKIDGAGAGSTVIDGNNAGSVLTLHGPNSSVSISDLSFTNGISPGAVVAGDRVKMSISDCAITGNATAGLRVGRRAKATVTRCEIIGNSGSGIASPNGDQRAKSRIDVIASTISGNSATVGGGISADVARLKVVDSTISNNTATFRGGGIDSDILTMSGSTVSGNDGDGLFVGAVFGKPKISNSTISGNIGAGVNAARVQLDHVTIANNIGAGLSTGPYARIRSSILADNGTDCSSAFDVKVSSGALVENPAGCNLVPLGGASILTGDPSLLPLQDNGGPTETQALDVGSIALAVLTKPSACNRPDQRGVPRSAPCDLGAFEAP